MVKAEEGKAQAMRQLRLDKNSKIDLDILKNYVEESIAMHDQGKTVNLATLKKVEIPIELKHKLHNNSDLSIAFNLLPPGKQKEYSLHIIDAKMQKTKLNRIEKIIPMILAGKGLNDKYRNC